MSVDSTALNRVAGVVSHETTYRDSLRPREEKQAEENKQREREFLTCADGCLAPWLLLNDIPARRRKRRLTRSCQWEGTFQS
jgi:hypothetical protein